MPLKKKKTPVNILARDGVAVTNLAHKVAEKKIKDTEVAREVKKKLDETLETIKILEKLDNEESLVEYLYSDSPVIRMATIKALHTCKDKKTIPDLITTLEKEEYPELKTEIIKVFKKLKKKQSLPAIRKELSVYYDSSKRDKQYARLLIDTLGTIKDKENIPTLERAEKRAQEAGDNGLATACHYALRDLGAFDEK